MGSDAEQKKPFLVSLIRLKKQVTTRRGLLVTGLVFIFLFICWFLLEGEEVEIEHFTSTPDQPLVIIKPGFLPEKDFDVLQKQLPTHPLIRANNLNAENFNSTSGWLVEFNLEGIEQFKAIPELQLVMPFFDKVRNPDSNAFVMNLLIADQTPPGKDAVGVHQDNTVGIRHPDEFYAHQVDVLYVKIPDGFQGGELEAWPDEHSKSEFNKVVVQPQANTLVEFKGTAYHRVRRFTSYGEPRIGLVLEQYRIEPIYYGYTIDFCLNKKCDEE
eukprot:g135.t1